MVCEDRYGVHAHYPVLSCEIERLFTMKKATIYTKKKLFPACKLEIYLVKDREILSIPSQSLTGAKLGYELRIRLNSITLVHKPYIYLNI